MKPTAPNFTPIIRQQPLPKLVVISCAGRRPLSLRPSTAIPRDRKVVLRSRAA